MKFGPVMTNPNPLRSIDPGDLRDRELELRLVNFTTDGVNRVPAYHFQMRNAGTGEEIGSIDLRAGSTPRIELYAGHIGYAVHPTHRGHRYAARSVRLLMPLARRLRLDPLWITCNPENFASRRSLEYAGAEFVEIVELPE